MPLSRRSLFALDFSGRSRPAGALVRVHRTVMACRFEVALAAADRAHEVAARAGLAEAERLDGLLCAFRDTSEVARVNRRAAREPVTVSTDVFELLQHCARISAETDGAFDVTTSALSRCWALLRRDRRAPEENEVQSARASVGMHRVLFDAAHGTVQFSSPGPCLGFGGIAKGYALDRMARALRSREVLHALVSAGGSSVLALGGRDKGWTIDVRPTQPGQRIRLRLRDGAVGTSGLGEQFGRIDGIRDGRVMDPRTGYPVETVRSATVVAAEAADADALSTAFVAGGPVLARSYCEAHPNTLAVLTMNDQSSTTTVFGAFAGATLLQ